MSVLRYYVCITYVFGSLRSLACNIRSLSYLSLVLCCDIHRSTLISIIYPACMITVHDCKPRVLQVVSEPTACRKPLTTTWSMLSLDFENYFANLMFGLRAHIVITTCDIYGIRILFSLPMLWDSALLSLLVSFTNSDIRITFF